MFLVGISDQRSLSRWEADTLIQDNYISSALAASLAFGSSVAHSLHFLTYVARSGHVPFRATVPPHEALYAAGAAPRRSYADERVQLREGTPRAQLGRRPYQPIKDVEAMMGHRCTRESLR
jgi:hypothetical protein